MYCPSSDNNGCLYLLRSVAADLITIVVHLMRTTVAVLRYNCCVSLRVYTLSLSQVAYDYYSVVKKSAPSNEAKYKVLHNSSKVFTTDTSSEVRHSVPGESWEITGEGDARLPSGSL